jgi:CheY-like chemotaxis protein
MRLSGTEVLLVGHAFSGALPLTERLQRWGFQCHFVENMRAACNLLSSRPVDLVLSKTQLSDGTGFGLMATLMGAPITAFLCLPVEESCFWLPAIDDGRECFGSPALRPREFANLLEELASSLTVETIQRAIRTDFEKGNAV